MAKGEGASKNAIVTDILETWFFEDQDTAVTVNQKLEAIIRMIKKDA